MRTSSNYYLDYQMTVIVCGGIAELERMGLI